MTIKNLSTLLLLVCLLGLTPAHAQEEVEVITCESAGLIYLHPQMTRNDDKTIFGYTLGRINTFQNLEITAVIAHWETNQIAVFLTILEPSDDPIFPSRIGFHRLSQAPIPKHHQDIITMPYQTGEISLINCEGSTYFKIPGIVPTISNLNTSITTELRSVRQSDFCELTFSHVMEDRIVLDQFYLGDAFVVAFGRLPSDHLWEDYYTIYLSPRDEVIPILTSDDVYEFNQGDGLTLGFSTPKGNFQLNLAFCNHEIHYTLSKF